MHRTITVLAAFAFVSSAACAQESRPGTPDVKVPTFANDVCPAMGKPAKSDLFVETPHGRIYICCKMCIKKIEADPEAMYKKAYPASKRAGNKVCPLTGESLEKDPATVSIQGWDIGLCCNDCAKGVLANSQIHLAKLANPKLKDLDNKTCPVTGKPVQNNAFCVIGDELVHLSSADAVETVKKDPKKALEKAKEGKPVDKKGGPSEACCSGGETAKTGCCSDDDDGAAESKPAKKGCCSGDGDAAESKPAKKGCCSGEGAAESKPAK